MALCWRETYPPPANWFYFFCMSLYHKRTREWLDFWTAPEESRKVWRDWKGDLAEKTESRKYWWNRTFRKRICLTLCWAILCICHWRHSIRPKLESFRWFKWRMTLSSILLTTSFHSSGFGLSLKKFTPIPQHCTLVRSLEWLSYLSSCSYC